jgi:hypothetical protein
MGFYISLLVRKYIIFFLEKEIMKRRKIIFSKNTFEKEDK